MLKLSVNYLKRFIKGQLFAFLLIFSGITVAAYGLFFLVGVAYNIYEIQLLWPKMNLVLEKDATVDEVMEIIEELKMGIKKDGNSIETVRIYHEIGEDVITGVYYPEGGVNGLLSGRGFEETEYMTGEKVVVISEPYARRMEMPDYLNKEEIGLKLGNEWYDIIGLSIGIYSMGGAKPEIAMPLKTYIERYPYEEMAFMFGARITARNRAEIERVCKKYMGISEVILPPAIDMEEVRAFLFHSGSYAMVIICSLISTLYIVSYWIEKSKRRFYAYILCGAKRNHIQSLVLISTLYLSVCATIIAWFIFKIMEPGLIRKEILQRTYWIYHAGGTILLIGSICAFAVITTMRFIKRVEFGGGKIK